MYGFMNNYPYFGMSLIICISLFICMFFFPSQRRFMLFSGLLSTPFCLYEFLFIPVYWKPVQLFGLIVSPSDILFSFATGGMACAATSLFVKGKIVLNFIFLIFLRRFLICTVIGLCLCFTLWVYGVKIMTSVLICILVGFIFISLRYRELGIKSLLGALGFVLFYASILKLCYVIWPHFYIQWNFNDLWELSFVGLPLEEIIWAFAFGAIWPKFMVYTFNGTIVR